MTFAVGCRAQNVWKENKTGKVRINMTLRRVRLTNTAMEKQLNLGFI